MNQKVVTSILSGLLAVLAGAHDAHADSVLHDWAPNFATLDTELWLKYDNIYGIPAAADVRYASGPHVIANSYLSNHYDSIANPPDLFPAFGPPKDVVTGRLEYKLDFGAPVLGSTLPDDTFDMKVSGNMSATDAWNSHGYESNAIVEAKTASYFYIDATHGGGTPGALVGYVLFPELMLQPFDTALEVHVLETDPVTGATASFSYAAPHADIAQEIRGNLRYDIQILYSKLVPYGVDPAYAFRYSYNLSYRDPNSGGGGAVPEPSATVLAGIVVMGLGLLRRRRKSY